MVTRDVPIHRNSTFRWAIISLVSAETFSADKCWFLFNNLIFFFQYSPVCLYAIASVSLLLSQFLFCATLYWHLFLPPDYFCFHLPPLTFMSSGLLFYFKLSFFFSLIIPVPLRYFILSLKSTHSNVNESLLSIMLEFKSTFMHCILFDLLLPGDISVSFLL